MSKTMNIYQKLLEIQKHVRGLAKDKQSHNFSYVTGNKLLGFVRPMMDDLGLILKTEVVAVENTRVDYKTKYGEKSEILTKVSLIFTWIDTETGETDINSFIANGMNDWDKGVGSAITYAERYFLLKYFHVPTDEDDVDNPDLKPSQQTRPIEAADTTASKESSKSGAIAKAVEAAKEVDYVEVKDEHESGREAYKQLYGKYPSSKMTTENIWEKVDEKNKLQAALNTVEALTNRDTFKADGERILNACSKSKMTEDDISQVKVALNKKYKTL